MLVAIAPQGAAAADAPTGPSTRIINGSMVPNVADQWPYIVALVDEDDFQFCGGTLISASWVLTAAHCQDVPAIIIGRKNLNGSGGERILVDSQIFHPQYDSYTEENDIQLLHLSHPVASPMPIDMIDAADDPATGASVSIAGWGVTESSGGDTVPDLRQATVNVVSNASCASAYAPEFYDIFPTMLCATYFDPADPDNGPNRDTCQGDSGGPLVANTPSGPRLAGITSWGIECALYPFPGVYTRVSSFKSWVLSKIGEKASFNTAKVDFGPRDINSGVSWASTVTVRSTGILPIAVTSASMTGHTDMAITSETCSAKGMMAPNDTCTVNLAYTPTLAGYANAQLKLTTSSANSPTESLVVKGFGRTPVVPPVLIKPALLVAQAGKAKKLPRGKIKVVVKGYFPIPAGSIGSNVCLSKGSMTASLPRGKKVALHGELGWFGTRCSVAFSMRLPSKLRRKKIGFDFHFDGNGAMAGGDKHVDVKIK